MRYIFFDIDGTLLLSGGAGRVAMTEIMTDMFGITDLCQIEVHGRTDRGIIRDLFDAHQLDLTESIREEFSTRYHDLLPQCMSRCTGQLMPGVGRLLNALAGQMDVRLGILTGNSRAAAWAKLEHFELSHFFKFGGYGDRHEKRDAVAREALQACREHFPDTTIAADQAWVVGDTIHDISCARAIGANVVAVATGRSDLELLKNHHPDAAFQDLSNAEAFLDAVSPSNNRQ